MAAFSGELHPVAISYKQFVLRAVAGGTANDWQTSLKHLLRGSVTGAVIADQFDRLGGQHRRIRKRNEQDTYEAS
jgi:hypothetical protein